MRLCDIEDDDAAEDLQPLAGDGPELTEAAVDDAQVHAPVQPMSNCATSVSLVEVSDCVGLPTTVQA